MQDGEEERKKPEDGNVEKTNLTILDEEITSEELPSIADLSDIEKAFIKAKVEDPHKKDYQLLKDAAKTIGYTKTITKDLAIKKSNDLVNSTKFKKAFADLQSVKRSIIQARLANIMETTIDSVNELPETKTSIESLYLDLKELEDQITLAKFSSEPELVQKLIGQKLKIHTEINKAESQKIKNIKLMHDMTSPKDSSKSGGGNSITIVLADTKKAAPIILSDTDDIEIDPEEIVDLEKI